MSRPANISVNFNEIVSTFKPMHGIGQPPMTGLSNSLFYYLKRAGMPYSRLHDVGGWMGGGLYVDIPNLFRNFDADENDPANYDFEYTDKLMEGLMEAGCEPYFRLGVTIENMHKLKAYRIFPPKDFEKWARICEHVIRHYNEGWANGYKFNITYWEIWNEPDDCYNDDISAMWKGTPEEYFRLYSITAKHLKDCFGDSIKIGGYGHCGVYEYAQDKDLNGLDHEDTYIYDFTISFMHGFFKYQQQTNAPIDFFTWHVYDNCHKSTRSDFRVIGEHAEYVRKILDRYGYTNAEHHLNEWNLHTYKKRRDEPIAAAKTLAFMLMMQDTSTDVMCYYDGHLGFSDYGAIINPDKGEPYRTYYAFMMYNTLYKMKNEVKVDSENEKISVQAAVDGRKGAIVLSNPENEDVYVNFDIKGFNVTDAHVLRIDEENRYTLTGEEISKGLMLPAYSCVEIKLFDLK